MRAKDKREWVLISLALAAFILPISFMWYTGIQDGSGAGVAASNILFPMFSCNFCTYLLFSLLLIPKGKVWNNVATMVAYAGTIGAFVTVADYLLIRIPDWQDFEFMKSLLSHAALLGGSVWLFVKKYVKINLGNMLPCLCYTLLCLADGLILFWLLPDANPMWFREPILEGADFLMGWNIAWMFPVAVLSFIAIFDLIKYKGNLKAAWKRPSGKTV
jgi:hypothetical protein